MPTAILHQQPSVGVRVSSGEASAETTAGRFVATTFALKENCSIHEDADDFDFDIDFLVENNFHYQQTPRETSAGFDNGQLLHSREIRRE